MTGHTAGEATFLGWRRYVGGHKIDNPLAVARCLLVNNRRWKGLVMNAAHTRLAYLDWAKGSKGI
jgi:hypothetical protein